MSKNYKVVTGKNGKDEEVTVVVRKPTSAEAFEAQKVYLRHFRIALDHGAFVDEEVEKILKERNIWNKDKEEKIKGLAVKIMDGEKKLARGGRDEHGNKVTLSEARDLALQMGRWRNEQLVILSERSSISDNTVQSIANNAKFDAQVALCTRYKDGDFVYDGADVFEKYQSYILSKEWEISIKAAEALAEIMYGLIIEDVKSRPENRFLLKYGFVDEKLRLINKDKHLIDIVDGEERLINEDGYYVDEQDNIIDLEGNKRDKDGNIVADFVEYEE